MEKSSATKADILKHLQEAKDLEDSIYTLEAKRDELEQQAKAAEADAEDILEGAHGNRAENNIKYFNDRIASINESIAECQRNILNAKEKTVDAMKPTDLRTDYTWQDFRNDPDNMKITPGQLVSIIFGCITLIGGIIIMLGGYDVIDDDVILGGIPCAGLAWLLGAALSSIVTMRTKCTKRAEAENAKNRALNAKAQRDNEITIQNYVNNVRVAMNAYNSNIDECQQSIEKCQAEIEECNASAERFRADISKVKNDIKPLYIAREKLYSGSIVPPGRRTRAHISDLYDVFSNDLADTMREAVLLCDERAFRHEVREMSAQLSEIMSETSSDTSMIRYWTSAICRDMKDVYDQNRRMTRDAERRTEQLLEQNRRLAAETARANERLYEEAKAHREAIEAIERSNQKIVDHLEN